MSFRGLFESLVRVVLFSLSLIVITVTALLNIWIIAFAALSLRFDAQNPIPEVNGFVGCIIAFVSLLELVWIEKAVHSESGLDTYVRVFKEIVNTFAIVTIISYFMTGFWLIMLISGAPGAVNNLGILLFTFFSVYSPLFLYALWHSGHDYIGIHLEHGIREGEK